VLQCRPLTPKWGVIEAQAGGFRNEDRLLGIGVTAAAHGRPDRVHAAKAPQIRCGASRRFRPREPRTERRPEGFVPRTCRLGVKREQGTYALAYSGEAPGPRGNTFSITFEPILPHGGSTCSACG